MVHTSTNVPNLAMLTPGSLVCEIRTNGTFVLAVLSQFKNQQSSQVPSLWSAAGTYLYFGRYQLSYRMSKKGSYEIPMH